jgi:hypothetical protein
MIKVIEGEKEAADKAKKDNAGSTQSCSPRHLLHSVPVL